jgi:hypothetical protein
MFHSVFSERKFQPENSYLPLHYIAMVEFVLDVFIRFCRESGVAYVVKSELSLIVWLYQRKFNIVTKPVRLLLAGLGKNRRDVAGLAARDCTRFTYSRSGTPEQPLPSGRPSGSASRACFEEGVCRC